MSEQVYDLGQSIRENSIIANEIIKRNSSYNFARVFSNSAYGIGIVGLGWVSIKLGVLIADTQLALAKGVELKTINERIKVLEAAIDKETPTSTVLPWWIMPAMPGSVYAMQIWDYLRHLINDPAIDIELANMAEELEALYIERAELKGDVPESKLTENLRAVDAVYGRYGPVLPVSVLGLNALSEFIRMRKVMVARVD